ncbi:hypothetical protein MFU01_51360 [Myxococcus fulvus]|uniref:Uncharacterized protein n=1 Tax=Myxococcus fulvus TaxID=33 RepID=A0A511T7F8_MYXFU|nr:hypothetical protein MFU01_51360 [Myxococcus fulvus]
MAEGWRKARRMEERQSGSGGERKESADLGDEVALGEARGLRERPTRASTAQARAGTTGTPLTAAAERRGHRGGRHQHEAQANG